MSTYYVTREDECTKCKGSGIIQAPIWKEFWHWFYLNDDNNNPTKKQVIEWWENRGYIKSDEDPYPEEKIDCPDCKGNGTIDSQVELGSALSDLIENLNILVGHPHNE